jgi:hypothetical protein
MCNCLTIFQTQHVGKFMTYAHLHNKFHTYDIGVSRDTDIKPICKCYFLTTGKFLFLQFTKKKKSPHETFHVFKRSRITHNLRTLEYVAPPPHKVANAPSGYYRTFYLLGYSTLKRRHWGVLQWHNVHIKLRANWSSGPKVRTGTHAQADNIVFTSIPPFYFSCTKLSENALQIFLY